MSVNKKTTGRKGFTLIELLVVIAIIAILAAILFPVFAKARERARATACLSNVKQIALAVQMYLGDHDGFFPMVFDFPVVGGPNLTDVWRGLAPYVENNRALFRCPNDNNPRSAGLHACTYNFNIVDYGGAYGGVLTRVPRYTDNSLNIDDISHPAGFVIVSETEDDDMITYGPDYWTLNDKWGPNWGGLGCDAFGYLWPSSSYLLRHGDSGNLAFADGHAKAININMTCTNWTAAIYCIELDHMYYTKATQPPS